MATAAVAARERARRREAGRRLAWVMLISLGAHLFLLLDGAAPRWLGLPGGAAQAAAFSRALRQSDRLPLRAYLPGATAAAEHVPHGARDTALTPEAPRSLAVQVDRPAAADLADARSSSSRQLRRLANRAPAAAPASTGASATSATFSREARRATASAQEEKALPALAAADDAPTGSDTAPPAESVRAYRFALALALRQLRGEAPWPLAEPPAAKAGVAEIVLAWEAGAAWPDVRLEQGSGDARRDAWVLDLVHRAAAQTPLPRVLRQHRHAFRLPVEFAELATP